MSVMVKVALWIVGAVALLVIIVVATSKPPPIKYDVFKIPCSNDHLQYHGVFLIEAGHTTAEIRALEKYLWERRLKGRYGQVSIFDDEWAARQMNTTYDLTPEQEAYFNRHWVGNGTNDGKTVYAR